MSFLEISTTRGDILMCDDDEFVINLNLISERIRNSSNGQLLVSSLHSILVRCLKVIEVKLKEICPEDSLSGFISVLKCVNEILKKCEFPIFNDLENIEQIFKLTAILNENELITDIGIQIQCLNCLHILVSSNYDNFILLFVKFNEIELIKNFFGSVDIKVQSLSWKLIKRVLHKNMTFNIEKMKHLLLDNILDSLESDTNIKIKITITDILLHILYYYNDEMRNFIKDFDSIQILLNQVHFEHQDIVTHHRFLVEKYSLITKYIWCLLQLVISNEEKRFFRDIGGIPIILSLLSLSNDQLEISNYTQESADVTEKYFLIIEAASTFISTLSKNENSSLEIVQKSGIYLLVQFLVKIPASYRNACILQFEKIQQLEFIEYVSKNAYANKHIFRALRFLFSLERNRKRFKNIFPAILYETFVDVGHFCENLDCYDQLALVYSNLSEIEKKSIRESIDCSNQKEETKCIRDYVILELLGSGAFGSVYKAKRKRASTGSYCAIKEVNLSEYQIGSTSQERCDSIYQIASELDIIKKQLRHPHVVRYYRTFNDAQNLYIVMAFLEGISLGEQINCMKEKKESYEETRIWKIVLQLIQALRYLHKSKGIIHRDLTPYNIIIGDNDYVTITDFGLAKQRLLESRSGDARSILGTLTYVCPEVIQHHPYGEKADIWALGCIIYQICTLTPPFTAQSELDLVNKICQGEYIKVDQFISRFSWQRLDFSFKMKAFIENAIVVDPKYRYDVLGLSGILVEEILINLDEIEHLLNKEIQSKKRLENQINESNANKLSMFDMQFLSLQGSSREASPSVSSVNNQNFDDSNTDSNSLEKSIHANNSDLKSSDLCNNSNSNSLSLSLNRSRIAKISSLDNSNTSTANLSEINLKRLHLQTSTNTEAVRMRPLNTKSLMSISQKSLRHITEDPITRILTWLHKIYFLSRADFQVLKCRWHSESDFIQTKRLFKMIFKSIFNLQPNQMKIELNNMISGRESSLQLNLLPNNVNEKLSKVSPEKLLYLMDDLLEKLNYSN